MDRARYDSYVARFNACDHTAFDEFLCPDMQMLNGALRFSGVEGMKDHYMNRIWPFFRETLNLLRFVSDDRHVAVELHTDFTALKSADTLFGAVEEGEQFIYRGLILYDLREGRFSSITVAYNSFTNIKTDGTMIEMGLPH